MMILLSLKNKDLSTGQIVYKPVPDDIHIDV